MLENWDFLIAELVVLLVLAAILGVIVGWILFGRRHQASVQTGEVEVLRAELATCRDAGQDQAAEIARLQDKLAAVERSGEALAGDDPLPGGADAGQAEKPATLTAPRDGTPDDLKRIKGVGPKLEALVNDLGFFHFDQIANWTDAEVAWVDANLEGFKGRVSRDNWVEQAKVLASGGSTA
jgi:predicted flap endonuclease-1-like 5' DNA nuclease